METTRSAPSPVRTRKSSRRALRFHCLNCIAAELGRIEAAHAAHTLTTTGNWTPGENTDHCTKLVEFALDGLPSSAPWFVRAVATLFLRTRATAGCIWGSCTIRVRLALSDLGASAAT